jgi:hypothetical protein
MEKNIKTIGLVVTIAGFTAVFIHFHYADRLTDSDRRIAGYKLKVGDLQKANQGLLREKNDLRARLDMAEKDLAPVFPSEPKQQPDFATDNPDGPGKEARPGPVDEDVAYPLELQLREGEPQLLWSGYVRVALGDSYEALEKATLCFHFGSQEHRIDLWADRRQTITVRGQTYWMDLLRSEDDSATVAISKAER